MGIRWRWFGFGAIIAAAVPLVSLGYLYIRQPLRARPAGIVIQITPERLARGKYIFELADCDGCHSELDYSRFGDPVLASAKGNLMPPDLGLPGTVVAPNITSDLETGIGTWTDGEKIRAIREGIGKDGRALFPMMPYKLYRKMSDEDVYSLVAYLDTLPPVRNPLPRTHLNFPVSLLIRSVPRPAGQVPPPDRSDSIRYGEYLVQMGACMDCHTPDKRGEPLPGLTLAGGKQFRMGPEAVVVSANITPEPETGIGRWSEQDFIDRFYQYREYLDKGSPVIGPQGFTLMPWLNLCKLPAEDLRAIYRFLRTQKPVYHSVETHPDQLAGSPQNQGTS
jgi:mono/diheme cytochrome c family protein